MKHSSSLIRSILLVALAPIAGAYAQSYTFIPNSGGGHYWSVSDNWAPGAGEPPFWENGAGTDVYIKRATGNATIFLDNTHATVGSLTFGETGYTTLGGVWYVANTTTGSITLDGPNSQIVANGNLLYFLAPITSSKLVTLRQTAPSAITLANENNNFSGGIHVFGGDNTYIYSPESITGGTFEITGFGWVRFNNGNGNGTLSAPLVLTGGGQKRVGTAGSGTLKIAGNISGASGLTLQSGAAGSTIELSGNNTYTGKTTVNTHLKFSGIQNFGNGAIEVSGKVAGGTAAPVRVIYNAGNTADLTRNRDGAVRTLTLATETIVEIDDNEVTWHNAVNGTGKLRKKGTGGLILSGDNTFNGLTIDQGTVTANHANAIGGGDLTFTGLETGTLNVEAGTVLNIDTLTLANNSTLSFSLNDDFTGTGLLVEGDQLGSGIYTIDIFDAGTMEMGTYTLIQILGNFEAGGFALGALPGDFAGSQLHWQNGILTLEVQPIPEPTSLALLALGFALGAWGLQRRRQIRELH